MASITSLIVLLLVTYCYSVPIGHNYDLTTEKTMIERGYDINMKFDTDDILAVTKDVDTKQSSDHSDIHEHHQKSVDEDLSFTTSVIDSISEKAHQLRSLNDGLFTTMESNTEFNARAFSSDEDRLDENKERRSELEMTTEVESSSSVEPELFTFHPTTSFPRGLNTIESFSTVEPESNTIESSSVNSYVKPIVEELTTSNYESVRVMEKLTSRIPLNSQPLVHTETIIPGEVTQAKVFTNVPSRTHLVDEAIPVQQSQLSQGQTRLFLNKENLNY